MGLHDWTGLSPLRQFSHVKITRPNHAHYNRTGTVVRIDIQRRRVWVALPGGEITEVSNRSVEVLTGRGK